MRLCLIAAVACVAARASFARAIGDAARHAREIVPEESGAAQPGTTDLNNLREVRSSEICSVGASALDKVIDDLVTMEMLEHGDFCLNCAAGYFDSKLGFIMTGRTYAPGHELVAGFRAAPGKTDAMEWRGLEALVFLDLIVDNSVFKRPLVERALAWAEEIQLGDADALRTCFFLLRAFEVVNFTKDATRHFAWYHHGELDTPPETPEDMKLLRSKYRKLLQETYYGKLVEAHDEVYIRALIKDEF
mmetsp:Transcript_32271/g.99476  ORF Transcript_32271/g.99476 Transcript_32271/m.99476 type:complete len:247 (+) Transcript_32271:201-941(+)